jgi:serine/threonine protein kinase
MFVTSVETRELGKETRQARGADQPAPVLLNVGAVLDGKYEILRAIGQGGMGRVVEVLRIADRRHLALKYCAGGGLGRRRLVRESRILGSLRHPHLMPVLDAGLDHDPPYFVMPLAVETLDTERLGHAGEVRWALEVFRQVCLGVQALHQAGVVHRDLKPANVLRLAEGRHVVADLGTAKREPRDSTVLTRTCSVLGTLSYLAPEQLLPGGSRQADARTDIFQLGKLLYQLLSGCNPAVIDPDCLPPGLARIVRRATSLRPDDRYRDIDALLRAVEQSAESSRINAQATREITVQSLLDDLARISVAVGRKDIDPDEVLDILTGLEYLRDDDVLDVFDRLPPPLLADLARRSAGRFQLRLRRYVACLERACGRRGFAYADLVAGRMRALIDACPLPEVVARAVEAALIVAVALNRYSAMSAVRQILYQTRGAEIALEIAEMLRERREYFQEIAPFLRLERLHPGLQCAVRDLDWIETVMF